jgi:DNA-binding response OmpR family regulator
MSQRELTGVGVAAQEGLPAGPISVLVVDDDPVTSAMLSALLSGAGYAVSTAANGQEAWDLLEHTRFPVVISDWYMPEIDGVELCRRIRARPAGGYVYFILITSHGGKRQYLTGMEAGADDFITKPVDPDELRARVGVAERILGLRRELQQLQELLPICSYCRRIRDDAGHWDSLEVFVEQREKAQFSHGICADCYTKIVQPQLDELGRGV